MNATLTTRPHAPLPITRLIAAMLLLLGGWAASADELGATRHSPSATSQLEELAPQSQDALFDALEAQEAPKLEDHRAGDLTSTELIISVIFIVLIFPLGIILLVIFAITDDDGDDVIVIED